ncbi:MAG: hypothetical protein SFX74_01980, partial [Fimbriimonadaceae bacterium]|nr:hypothetical protein [Fimbriimonadaceae bacterium]
MTVFGLAITIVGLWLIWWMVRPARSLGDVAHDALKSLIARDVNGLTNAVCEADYDDTGMTKEQARQAIQHVIV